MSLTRAALVERLTLRDENTIARNGAINMTKNSSYLTMTPDKVHRFWWTCFPALPRCRDTHAYHALKRVWFDHTINTFREVEPGHWQRRARGFYTEGSEDHITPVLFENWALFPEPVWVPSLLAAYGIRQHGTVRRVRWSPFFEQVYDGKKFCIADIVVCWEDEAGLGVLVLEAKVRGRRLEAKDLPEMSRYLHMPSIRAVERRHYGLLVDAEDAATARAAVNGDAAIATWQTLARLQIAAAQSLQLSSLRVDRIVMSLAAHFAYFGIDVEGQFNSSAIAEASGTAEEYAEIRSYGLPTTIEDYAIGSQVVFAARRGRMPEAPYQWLQDEPDCISIYLRGKQHERGYQTTADRRVPRWPLDWEP